MFYSPETGYPHVPHIRNSPWLVQTSKQGQAFSGKMLIGIGQGQKKLTVWMTEFMLSGMILDTLQLSSRDVNKTLVLPVWKEGKFLCLFF